MSNRHSNSKKTFLFKSTSSRPISNIKKEDNDDDDILFIEEVKTPIVEKPTTDKNDQKDVDMGDKNEFIFNYTQDDGDIPFDSDDELISVFDLHQISQDDVKNNTEKESVNSNEKEKKNQNDEEDEEEDDDIKFIMDKNNEFFSKIDSLLIDLTKDDDSPVTNTSNKTKVNIASSTINNQKVSNQNTSPIVIKQETKATSQLKQEEKPVNNSEINFKISKIEEPIQTIEDSIIEDTSSNDALLCQVANDYENKLSTQKEEEVATTTKTETKSVVGLLKFKEIRLEAIDVNREPKKNVSPESNNNKIKLKRLRELSSSSSDEDEKEKKTKSIQSPIFAPKKAKRIDSSDDDNTHLNSPRVEFSFTKFPTKSPLLQSNKTTMFENNTSIATGENLLGRATKLIEAPVTMKKFKQSLQFNRQPSRDETTKTTSSNVSSVIKPTTSESLNESEENQQPKLNPVDLKKKQALEKLSKSYTSVQPIVKKSKAMEDLKKMNFKEKNLVLNTLPKKPTAQMSNELSLTQQCNLGKLENIMRLQKVLDAQRVKTTETSNSILETTPTTSTNTLTTTAKLQSNNVKPIQLINHNVFESSKPKKPIELPKQKEPIKSDNSTAASIKIQKVKPIVKNDIVGSIISDMNKQNNQQGQQLVNKSNDKNDRNKITNDFCCEKFIIRILNWKYVWLVEQEKFVQQNNFNAKRLPPVPVVANEELMPIVDKYVNYNEYHKAIFPFLLLETWEEISRAFRDNLSKKKDKVYSNIPIWSKCIEKSETFPEMSILKCQTIIEDHQKTNFEDDVLKLNLGIVDTANKQQIVQTDCLGMIHKAVKLKEGAENSILEPVKEYAKGLENKLKKISYTEQSPSKSQQSNSRPHKKSFHIFEFSIYVKSRRYYNKPYLQIEYEYLTNLSSSLRRIRSLISFRNSAMLKTVLSPSINDPFYHVSQSDKNTNNGQQLTLPNINNYNDSQKEVILEASSLVNNNEPKLYFIQGPPGTGKTFTIIGIIKAMLARASTIKKITKPDQKVIKKNNLKLLICSPSNAGCDEIARRLKEHKDLLIVRVGVTGNLHPDCEEFNLSVLAKKKYQDLLNKEQCKKSDSLRQQDETFRSRESLFKKRLRELKSAAVPNVDYIKNTENMLEELLKRKKEFEDALRKANSKDDISAADKKKFDYMSKEKVLRDADIIICTLNYSGNSILDCLTMEKNHGVSLIDVVIIDEAAQCLEVDFLIPMRFQCNKVIQVGDPEQLPATVMSSRAQDFKFQKSFFERIYNNFFFEEKNPIRMLYIQYRMHPEICIFPSLNFYRGRLVTHEQTINERKKLEIEPYLVFDVPDSKEEGEDDNGSLSNLVEAEQVIDFSKMMRKNFKQFSIGIITPYQKQVHYLNKLINENNLDKIEVGTVDSFQGREKDVILFSSVRSNSSNNIGFVANKQRLNVSLTRAKHALYIFCNVKTLVCNEDWKECIKNATMRNLVRVIRLEKNNRK